jgi:glycosyltransferase involved in cell wall biosynthesis
VARLEAVKDHASLVRAVAMLAPRWPALHLCLVGDGAMRESLERVVRDEGVGDRVHFAGQRPNTPNLHHAFDISALASLSEGFPNSLVEAMAAGRPVVATDVGGNPDAVRAETGLLVPPAQPDQMARAIERLLGDPALRASMGREALRVARREYHGDAVVPRLEDTYLHLLGRTA